jgi:putative hydrolase of the HAD superfamily
MDQPIRGILFDLGDTLLEFGKIDAIKLFAIGAQRGYQYLAELGLPLPEFSAYHRRQYWAVRWLYFKSRLTRRDFNIMESIDRIGRTFGHQLTRENLVELAWRWYEPLSETVHVEQGLTEMLSGLAQRGLKLGVVSNTFLPMEVLDMHLAKAGLLKHLPDRVYSSQTGFRKPARSIFELALSTTGLEPSQTVFVGDSPWADIRGSNRMGMISVLKDPAGRHGPWTARPRHRIRSILQLPKILDQYDC